MDPFKSSDTTTRASSLARSSFFFIALVIGLQIIIVLFTYPFLPARVPSHWDVAGQIDGYMPKGFNVLLLPAISIIFYILLRIILAPGSNMFKRDNQQAVLELTIRRLPAIFLYLLCLQLIIIAAAFGIPVKIDFFVPLLISLLCIYIGNYMGKLRRNTWMGIKTPWTLADDRVWERTHRLAGWLFVVVGVSGVVVSFLPVFAVLRITVVVGGMLLISIALYIYSYIIYRQVRRVSA